MLLDASVPFSSNIGVESRAVVATASEESRAVVPTALEESGAVVPTALEKRLGQSFHFLNDWDSRATIKTAILKSSLDRALGGIAVKGY